MRKILSTIAVLSALTLASCGKTAAVKEESTAPETTAASTASQAEKTTTTAETTTTAATTTKAPENAGDAPEAVQAEISGSVEVYSETAVREIISSINAELAEPDVLIDTGSTGEKKMRIPIIYEGKKYEKEITYNVADTTKPLVVNSGWNPYVKLGQPFNIDSIVGYIDNYDRQPSITYTGDVNTSEVGSYPISVTVTDSSGNSSSWDMDVLVLNEIPRPEDNEPRVTFDDFMAYYNYVDVSYGIDVSTWQGSVDYDAVRNAGAEFVLMRVGFYYSGEVEMDDCYQQNIANASAAGLDVGVYFYSADNTEEGAREHARWIIDQLGGKQTEYPIAFDWEEWGTIQEYGMNLRDLNNVFEAFCDEVEKHGYKAMLYSSKNFLENVWENRNNHPVWLAHYTDETDYSGPFAIWQASSVGRIPGIAGDVDMNIRFKNIPLE
ncbi:MAG: DUF5011 domain-containing protein [Ruminococcus sp.]|nr:DUF5011 domain-containing protein [Ruminococcus sp.]